MYKVIGSGMIAKGFKGEITQELNCTIFASGVSDSSCNDFKMFKRESDLLNRSLMEIDPNSYFVYFGTCSIYDKDLKESPYVKHKIDMERIVLGYDKSLVFRLPQVAGPNPPKGSILSSIKDAAILENTYTVWKNATRNIIDISDVKKITLNILRNHNYCNTILNVANNRNYSVMEIITAFEKCLRKKINVQYLNKGSSYYIDIELIRKAIKDEAIYFENYLERVIKKYYCIDNYDLK